MAAEDLTGDPRRREHDEYLLELKYLVELHCRAQGISVRAARKIMTEIDDAQGPSKNSWPNRWIAAGDLAVQRGDILTATKFYNLGRFPFIDSHERQIAHRRCIDSFLEWQRACNLGVVVLRLTMGARSFKAYVRRSGVTRAPAIVVIGGIVSIKEQWGSLFHLWARFGVDVIVTEAPGVGENELAWDSNASSMITTLLDAVGVTEDSGGCFIVAMSFGGTLALRAAAVDPRIRGVSTVGAPIAGFFTNERWWSKVPETTRRTLGRILDVNDSVSTFQAMAELGLRPDEIERIRSPIWYVKSNQDEIIPPDEIEPLLNSGRKLHVLMTNDVHGSPNWAAAVRVFIGYSILHTLMPKSVHGLFLRAALSVFNMMPGLAFYEPGGSNTVAPSRRTPLSGRPGGMYQ
jgi:esterase FrsA